MLSGLSSATSSGDKATYVLCFGRNERQSKRKLRTNARELQILAYLCVSKKQKMDNIPKFHELRADKVLNAFSIVKKKHCEHLNHWLTYSENLTETELSILEIALQRYDELGDGWNEEELKMHFISLVFAVANVNIAKTCKTFYERPLTGIVQGRQLNVICDCMVAQPDFAGLPTMPYFFLQEYKQAQRFGKSAPEGQMLAAMLIAQEKHQNGKPLYGSFIIERHWYFTTLQQNEYCVSKAYDATVKEKLLEITCILRQLKRIIQQHIATK